MSDVKHHDGWNEHEEVWLLLPWYANGTLEAAERALVEEHLGGCPSCGEELARCNGLAAALAAGAENAPSPHPIQLARLMERVEASERGFDALHDALQKDGGPARDAGHAGNAAGIAGRRASLLASTPVPVRWALAAQLGALVLLSATLVLGPGRPGSAGSAGSTGATGSTGSKHPARYVTLSAASPAAMRPQIRLIFSEAATGKEIRDVLLRTRGRLVDGPSPIGAYTLELPAPAGSDSAGGPDAAAAAAAGVPAAPSSAGARAAASPEPAADSPGIVLAYLRTQRIVRFAEPVAGAPWPASAAAPAPPARPAPPAAGRSTSPSPLASPAPPPPTSPP
jgi:hypothetical protein